ncbi:unnamed protein product [Nezara viridula]|uniref:Neuropeptide n=1 Tax=Nezara viridula TaxID=85310 RepID=A0A9P0MNM3_NEZVI|nr:unnamed protein product [Nezara viridula]
MWVFTTFLVVAFFHASVSQYFNEDAEEQRDFGKEEVDRDDDGVIVVINDDPEPNDGWKPDEEDPLQAGPPPEYMDVQAPPSDYLEVPRPPQDYFEVQRPEPDYLELQGPSPFEYV